MTFKDLHSDARKIDIFDSARLAGVLLAAVLFGGTGAAEAADLGCGVAVRPASTLAFDGTSLIDMTCGGQPLVLKPREFDYMTDGFYTHVWAPPGTQAPIETGFGWRAASFVLDVLGGLAAKFETGLKEIVPTQGGPVTAATIRTEITRPLGHGLDLDATANIARSFDTDAQLNLSARWHPPGIDGNPSAALSMSMERTAGLAAADGLRRTTGLTLGTAFAGGRLDAGVTLVDFSGEATPQKASVGTMIGFKRSF
jgi:hypothetical protein